MLVEVLSGKKGGCSEEHSPEEGVSCCVEPVLPAGLPEPGQAIPSGALLLNGKCRVREVLMGQEPNRLEMFGAFLQGLERGKNLPPPSLAATTGERKLITQVEENES